MRGGIGNAASPTPPAADEIRSSRWLVRTVGVQCRSRRELGEHILRQAFGNDDGDADQIGAANALLCVSGSHPVRQLSIMGRLLPSSLDTLAMAGEMKARGNLPGSLRLWAVENPLLEYDAQRLRRKIEAGAEVVVTQPPLDWDSFQRWADDADRLGLLEQCQLVVGLPMLSSAGNLAFWLQLCGAHSAPWAQSVLKRWSDEESKGAESFQEWRLQQTVELMQRIGSLPGAAGVHVMPLTKRAREDALAVIESGAIAPWVVQDD
uniref:Uncharacterized protein n=1 Tax=Tetraselmis sp. GSL018 TaxID=582737 RepID=A0A061R353_9CHLO